MEPAGVLREDTGATSRREADALLGDPRRPYVVLNPPMGNGVLGSWDDVVRAWTVFWELLERLDVVGGIAGLVSSCETKPDGGQPARWRVCLLSLARAGKNVEQRHTTSVHSSQKTSLDRIIDTTIRRSERRARYVIGGSRLQSGRLRSVGAGRGRCWRIASQSGRPS